MIDLIFRIDMDDHITLFVRNKDGKEKIDMPQNSLYHLFRKYLEIYDYKEKITNVYTYIEFKKINKKEILYNIKTEKKLLNKIEKQEKKRKKEKKKEEKLKNNKRKVTRKNKFKNVIITVGLATAVTLVLIFANPKDIASTPDIIDNSSYISQVASASQLNDVPDDTIISYENEVDILQIVANPNADMKKYNDCVNNYGDIITKYAEMYGIDPKLAIALCTQERGYHSEQKEPDGGLGLCQINTNVWNNADIRAYNFETNSYETYHIEEKNLKNVDTNIKVGMMILQNSMNNFGYIITQGLQGYNYGFPYTNECLKVSGLNSEELNDQNNNTWFQYRDMINGGDPEYVENVFRYIEDGTILTFKRPNGTIVQVQYFNEQPNLTM